MDMQKPTAAVYQQSYCGQFHCKRVFFDMIHCIQTRPPHLFYERLCNGQPQTVTAVVFPGVIHPIKTFEDFINMLWCDAFSRIRNR